VETIEYKYFIILQYYIYYIILYNNRGEILQEDITILDVSDEPNKKNIKAHEAKLITARRNKCILVGESRNKHIRTYSMQVSKTHFRRK